ncbi:MAG TPA: hypothetical protein VFY13_07165 [Luteolibacter sp.]|nr:hypothetical protein [Luteolibacter sp.]
MKSLPAIMCCAVFAAGTLAARAQQGAEQAQVIAEPVPQEAIDSAVAAVAELGQAVVQGKYQRALDCMNPTWKERYAKRVGGMKKLEERLQAVAAEMVRNGVTMVSCQPSGKPEAYGVSPVNAKVVIDGKTVEGMRYSQWLVLVPTVTRYRVMQREREGGPVKWLQLENQGFQVAVSDRGKNQWTFIDGSGLAVSDLRSLYITLPQNMQLPQVGSRQIEGE